MKWVASWVVLIFWLTPGGAVPAPAQESSPSPEQRLRERVDGVYQLFVTGQWRAVMNFLTEDSKDIWFGLPKGKMDSFEIQEIRIDPDGQRADVKVMSTFRIPQVDAPFHQPQNSEWFYQEGDWFLKLKEPKSLLETMMSQNAQNPIIVQPPLVFDENPVKIPAAPDGESVTVKVPFRNDTPTAVAVRELATSCQCLKAVMDPLIIPAQSGGVLSITFTPPANFASGRTPAVHALLAPSMYLLNLPLVIKEE